LSSDIKPKVYWKGERGKEILGLHGAKVLLGRGKKRKKNKGRAQQLVSDCLKVLHYKRGGNAKGGSETTGTVYQTGRRSTRLM